MNKLVLISVLLGVIAAISVSLVLSEPDSVEPGSDLIYDAGFTYYDIQTIQTKLSEQNISVSTPTAITDHTIDQYCTFFDEGMPRTVDYCTTTAVLDSQRNPLGNINIGGDINSPIMAVANLETPTLESNSDETMAIFETMIETLVCDCWEEEESLEFESVSDWVKAVQTFYYDSDERNIKSKIDNLGDVKVFLEITSQDNSVLQTLIILK